MEIREFQGFRLVADKCLISMEQGRDLRQNYINDLRRLRHVELCQGNFRFLQSQIECEQTVWNFRRQNFLRTIFNDRSTFMSINFHTDCHKLRASLLVKCRHQGQRDFLRIRIKIRVTSTVSQGK